MVLSQPESSQLRFAGCAMLALAVLLFAISRDSPPPRASLDEVTGQLGWGGEKYAGKFSTVLRFGLRDNAPQLQYVSNAGGIDEVRQALEAADGEIVTFLVDPASTYEYRTVYEVRIGDRIVRSYEEVLHAWRQDNAFGQWGAAGSALVGILLLAYGLKSRYAA